MMLKSEKQLENKRIGIFGKGGSGKSTVAVLLTRALRDQGYHVCLLDADSTNVGLAKALGFEQSPTPLLEFYGGMVFSGGAVTCPVDDPTPLPRAEISMKFLPLRYFVHSDGITLLIAGKIGDKGPGAGCDGPISKIARDLRIHNGDEPIVTIVDFKAGFEDTARGAVTSLDWAIVVVDPTLASIVMAKDMRDLVNRIKAAEPPATMHLDDPKLITLARCMFLEAKIKDVLFVMNKIQDAEMENYLRMELSTMNIEPVGVIHEDSTMRNAWLMGKPLYGKNAKPEAQKIALALDAAETIMGEVEAMPW